MLTIGFILIVVSTSFAYFLPCAYWCEGSCTKKVTSFYCCSYQPSLEGPKEFLSPPCSNLCTSRTKNDPAYLRNCKTEIEESHSAGTFQICTNFNDCNATLHDVCCPDNCLPENKKMCIKLE